MGEALTIEARLRERLSELAASGPLVADLDQVRFMDSAGLAALAGAANRAPRTAAACTWSVPGRRSVSCSG